MSTEFKQMPNYIFKKSELKQIDNDLKIIQSCQKKIKEITDLIYEIENSYTYKTLEKTRLLYIYIASFVFACLCERKMNDLVSKGLGIMMSYSLSIFYFHLLHVYKNESRERYQLLHPEISTLINQVKNKEIIDLLIHLLYNRNTEIYQLMVFYENSKLPKKYEIDFVNLANSIAGSLNKIKNQVLIKNNINFIIQKSKFNKKTPEEFFKKIETNFLKNNLKIKEEISQKKINKIEIFETKKTFIKIDSKEIYKTDPLSVIKNTIPIKKEKKEKQNHIYEDKLIKKLILSIKKNSEEEFQLYIHQLNLNIDSQKRIQEACMSNLRRRQTAGAISDQKKSQKILEIWQNYLKNIDSPKVNPIKRKFVKKSERISEKKLVMTLVNKKIIENQLISIENAINAMIQKRQDIINISTKKEKINFFFPKESLKKSLIFRQILINHTSKNSKIYFVGGFPRYLTQNEKLFLNREIDIDMIAKLHAKEIIQISEQNQIVFKTSYTDHSGRSCLNFIYQDIHFDLVCDPHFNLNEDSQLRDFTDNTIYLDTEFHDPNHQITPLIDKTLGAKDQKPFIQACSGHLKSHDIHTLLHNWGEILALFKQKNTCSDEKALESTLKNLIDNPMRILRIYEKIQKDQISEKLIAPEILFCLQQQIPTIIQTHLLLDRQNSAKNHAKLVNRIVGYWIKKFNHVDKIRAEAFKSLLKTALSCQKSEKISEKSIENGINLLFFDDQNRHPIYPWLYRQLKSCHNAEDYNDTHEKRFPLLAAIALTDFDLHHFSQQKLLRHLRDTAKAFSVFESIAQQLQNTQIPHYIQLFSHELAEMALIHREKLGLIPPQSSALGFFESPKTRTEAPLEHIVHPCLALK